MQLLSKQTNQRDKTVRSSSANKIHAAVRDFPQYWEYFLLLRKHLDEPVKTAIACLEPLLDGEWHRAEEISQITGISVGVVRQTLKECQKAGLNITPRPGRTQNAGWQLEGGVFKVRSTQ